MLTEKQVPYTGPYGLPGSGHKAKGPTAQAIKRAMKRYGSGFQAKDFSELDEHYNEATEKALDKAIAGMDGYGQKRWEALRNLKVPADRPSAGQYALDLYAQELIANEAKAATPTAKVPDLGPIQKGGKSVLAQDLTHATSGIPLYPAFDDAFSQGVEIIAPEDIVVAKKLTSSNPGSAIYAEGLSKIDYWFGHLDRNHALGTKFKKGAVIGKTCPNSIGGGPHVHLGVNVERLLGKGKQLEHHTNYTHGAPLIGDQLEKALL